MPATCNNHVRNFFAFWPAQPDEVDWEAWLFLLPDSVPKTGHDLQITSPLSSLYMVMHWLHAHKPVWSGADLQRESSTESFGSQTAHLPIC